jgi:hypothetical protein
MRLQQSGRKTETVETRGGEIWRQLLDDMPTVKTADFDLLLDALRHRINNFATIVEPFDTNFRNRRLAFSTYRSKKRGIHEGCRRLTFWIKKIWPTVSP